MKKIEAFVKPFTLESIKETLADYGISIMAMADARELGGEQAHDRYRGTEYMVDAVPRTMIAVLAADEQVETVIRLIRQAAQTDHAGDGRIVVTPVDRVVHLDAEALVVNGQPQ